MQQGGLEAHCLQQYFSLLFVFLIIVLFSGDESPGYQKSCAPPRYVLTASSSGIHLAWVFPVAPSAKGTIRTGFVKTTSGSFW